MSQRRLVARLARRRRRRALFEGRAEFVVLPLKDIGRFPNAARGEPRLERVFAPSVFRRDRKPALLLRRRNARRRALAGLIVVALDFFRRHFAEPDEVRDGAIEASRKRMTSDVVFGRLERQRRPRVLATPFRFFDRETRAVAGDTAPVWRG